ncbi:MAG: trypsin-like serine protease, partial [Planctomycetes bacterium]|nr:trypsin-like serine protease [Planctomycetota bacterium]
MMLTGPRFWHTLVQKCLGRKLRLRPGHGRASSRASRRMLGARHRSDMVAAIERLEDRTLLSQVVVFDPINRLEVVSSHADETLFSTETHQIVAGVSGAGAADFRPDELPWDVDSTIFGSDDRVRVTNTTAYPWRTIGRLEITWEDGTKGHCSGAMISQNEFLTAGHCVHQKAKGGWAKSLRVSLGQNDSSRPFGEASWRTARSYTGWTQGPQDSTDAAFDHDWAVITLDRNIGLFTGWLGYEWWSGNSIYNGLGLNTAGYPGDLGGGNDMYRAFGPTDSATANQIHFTGSLDIWPGQSGSPLWRFVSSTGDRFVNGIVSHQSSANNGATRINETKFNSLLDWRAIDDTTNKPVDRPDLTDYDDWFGTNHSGISTTSVRAWDDFSATARVRNNGTAAAGNFRVSFYASTNDFISSSDYHLGDVTVSSLSSFNSQFATWSGSFPPGIP